MNFFRSMLSIIALCAIGSVNAKGLKKGETPTTTPSTQPQPKPITSQPARPKPTVKTRQPAQQKINYDQLRNLLDSIEPSAENFPIIQQLDNIAYNKYAQSFEDFTQKLTLPLSNEMRTLMDNHWNSFCHYPSGLDNALKKANEQNPIEFNKLINEKTSLGKKIKDYLQ